MRFTKCLVILIDQSLWRACGETGGPGDNRLDCDVISRRSSPLLRRVGKISPVANIGLLMVSQLARLAIYITDVRVRNCDFSLPLLAALLACSSLIPDFDSLRENSRLGSLVRRGNLVWRVARHSVSSSDTPTVLYIPVLILEFWTLVQTSITRCCLNGLRTSWRHDVQYASQFSSCRLPPCVPARPTVLSNPASETLWRS